MIRNALNSFQKSISNHPFRRSLKPTSPLRPNATAAAADSPTQRPQTGVRAPPITGFTLYSLSSQSELPVHFPKWAMDRRGYCNGGVDYSNEVDEINLKFAEAREDIDAAMESKDTLYFNEEAECARESVKGVLDMFDGLLARLPEQEKAALQRSMGLKMHQLKAELEQLNE